MNRADRRAARARAVRVDRVSQRGHARFDVACGPEGGAHAFEIDALGETAPNAVCGAARAADVNDHATVCDTCGPWMLREVGSDDPEREFERIPRGPR
jgi:hypothetical protein